MKMDFFFNFLSTESLFLWNSLFSTTHIFKSHLLCFLLLVTKNIQSANGIIDSQWKRYLIEERSLWSGHYCCTICVLSLSYPEAAHSLRMGLEIKASRKKNHHQQSHSFHGQEALCKGWFLFHSKLSNTRQPLLLKTDKFLREFTFVTLPLSDLIRSCTG